LRKIKIINKIAELRFRFAHIWPWIPSAICLRIETLTHKKIILDKLQVRVAAQDLMVDEV